MPPRVRPRATIAAITVASGALAAASLVAAGCTELKRADEPVDASVEGGVTPVEEAGTSDAAVVDAGPPPSDFECNGDPWTKPTKSKSECAPRRVFDVETTPVLLNVGISIARTPAGRVGISYNAEQGGETGELHLLHFVPSSPTFTPTLVKRATAQYFHDGYMSRLAATAPDTLHVLTYDMDDAAQDGEIHLRKLVGGKEPLSDALVMTGVKRPTEIGFAVDGAETAWAAVRVATGATTAKLSARKKTKTGAVELLPDLDDGLLVKEAPGAGASWLHVDPAGQLHVLLHHNEVMQHSTPRYHTLSGTTWSYRKTIDNARIDGLSGYSPRVATFGNKKFAVFYFRKALQSNPVTADLRLATWESADEEPKIEILDQGIPSEVAMDPRYRVALSVDKFGLVHLAIVRPTGADNGYLEYRRQTAVDGGGTKWLSDIVDYDVLSAQSPCFVDLVVDENARPHIAYRSSFDNRVKYATRFDR